MQRLQGWFASMDRDRSGALSVNEVSNLQFGGGPIGTPVARKLMNVFDKDASGTIDFHEFVSLNQFLTQAQTAFYSADRDRSGTLDQNEASAALQQMGFQMAQRTVSAVVAKADRNKRGVNFSGFLRIAGHLATVRSIFEWNDPKKTGKIELTYDQLAHITTHLLDDI
jgi:Ca2+-binding EF-hand superfamily protein